MPAHYQSLDLPGGVRLAVASLPWAESAAFGVWVPAGSRHDPEPLTGLAHFVEHMVFKGTERRDARAISFEIEGQGGSLNASTSEEHTCYEAYAEAELLPLLADITTDLVWHPTFPASEFELEREVIREEILHYRDSPSDHVTDMLARALWHPHRLGHPISGTPESLDLIERRHLLDHAAAAHHRRGMVVGVAGPVGPEEARQLVEPLLPVGTPAPPPAPDPFAPDPTAAPRHLRESRDTGQLHLALGFPTPGRHDPDRFALRLLSLIIGENSSSRLFQELRERRGLCYHVASDVSLFEETGALEITLALEPEQRSLALETIRRELDDLMENGPAPPPPTSTGPPKPCSSTTASSTPKKPATPSAASLRKTSPVSRQPPYRPSASPSPKSLQRNEVVINHNEESDFCLCFARPGTKKEIFSPTTSATAPSIRHRSVPFLTTKPPAISIIPLDDSGSPRIFPDRSNLGAGRITSSCTFLFTPFLGAGSQTRHFPSLQPTTVNQCPPKRRIPSPSRRYHPIFNHSTLFPEMFFLIHPLSNLRPDAYFFPTTLQPLAMIENFRTPRELKYASNPTHMLIAPVPPFLSVPIIPSPARSLTKAYWSSGFLKFPGITPCRANHTSEFDTATGPQYPLPPLKNPAPRQVCTKSGVSATFARSATSPPCRGANSHARPIAHANPNLATPPDMRSFSTAQRIRGNQESGKPKTDCKKPTPHNRQKTHTLLEFQNLFKQGLVGHSPKRSKEGGSPRRGAFQAPADDWRKWGSWKFREKHHEIPPPPPILLRRLQIADPCRKRLSYAQPFLARGLPRSSIPPGVLGCVSWLPSGVRVTMAFSPLLAVVARGGFAVRALGC